MVAPIGNIQTSLPTMYFFNNIGMDKFIGTNPVINYKIKDRSSYIKKNLSRDTFIFSTYSSIIYYEKVTMNNGMDVNSDLSVESPVLFYETEQKKALRLNKATETTSNIRLFPFRQIMAAIFLLTKHVVKLLAMIIRTSLTFKSHIIQILLQNPNYRVETSIPFLYMAL